MSPVRLTHRWAILCAAGVLLLSGLACATSGPGPNAAATVEALNLYVEQTLAAQTSVTPGAVTDTPVATLALPTPRPTPIPASPEPPTPLPTWRPAVPTATVAPSPTAAPSATATELARPNGSVVLALYSPSGPVIDGDLGEWAQLPHQFNTPIYKPDNWVGPNDNTVSFNLAWNQQYLFLAAAVVDDLHVQTQRREMMYQGDSLEILFDADLAGDFTVQHLNADDFQLGLSPGALNGDTPEAWLWFPSNLSGQAATVTIATRPDGQGYRLEAAIPWQLLNIAPAGGLRYGFVLSASDNDSPSTAEQQSLIASVNTRKLTDPTTWGILALDHP